MTFNRYSNESHNVFNFIEYTILLLIWHYLYTDPFIAMGVGIQLLLFMNWFIGDIIHDWLYIITDQCLLFSICHWFGFYEWIYWQIQRFSNSKYTQMVILLCIIFVFSTALIPMDTNVFIVNIFYFLITFIHESYEIIV